MDLVVDANILFAALIKDSVTAELLFVDEFHLAAPEFLFTEFANNKEETLEKTHRSTHEFHRLLDVLERRIELVPREEIKPLLPEAEEISPDPKDTVYIALAMKLGAAIWTNEKRLQEKQDTVPVYATHDLVDFLHNRGHSLEHA